MKIETGYEKKEFYTEQEVNEIREKMSDIKLPNNHRNMKITDLAREALTSKTVIINMAQKLGFLGYADF